MLIHKFSPHFSRYCSSREDIDTMFEYLKDISTPGKFKNIFQFLSFTNSL